MSGNGQPHNDDQSLFKSGEQLKQAPAMFTEWSRQVSAWARYIREHQPMTEAVPDQIEAAAAVLAALAADADAWYTSYARGNEADRARAETPRRGSRTVEKNADVTAYERDM